MIPRFVRWRADWSVFLFALGILGFATIQSYQRSVEADVLNSWVSHTLDVLQSIGRLEYATLSREAEHRAYLLRGDARFEQASELLAAEAADALASLKQLVVDNPGQKLRVERIAEALAAREDEISLRQASIGRGGLELAQREFLENGAQANVALQEAISALGEAERQLLAERTEAASRQASKLRWSLLYGPGIALVILVAGFVVLRRQFISIERMSQALGATNALQRAMLDGSGHMIVAVDPEGTVTLFNRAASVALGYSPDEIVGRTTPAMFHDRGEIEARARELTDSLEETVPAGMDVFTALPMRGKVDRRQWTYVDSTGHRFPVQLTVTAVRSEAGDLLGFMGIAEDIGERLRAEQEILALNASLEAKTEQLEDSVRELESFTYSISHDLRAPLRHIHGYAEMLDEDAGDSLNGECRRYLKAIGDSSRRLGLLIDDLLTLSRLGKRQFELRLLEMQPLVEMAIDDIRGEEKLLATIRVDPLPPAYGDAALLRQVWVNLLSNAVKYSSKRGAEARIAVSATQQGDIARYEVSDNGIGFDMKYSDKLFGVFQRLHMQEDFEGTGVGLAIVQRIVKRMGGSVFAFGELDNGASFGFTLPTQGELK